jgi:transmembrane sensor
MSPQAEHIAQLLVDHLNGLKSQELEDWLHEQEGRRDMLLELTDQAKVVAMLQEYETHNHEPIASALEKEFPGISLSATSVEQKPVPRPAHRVHFLRTGFMRYAAAIVLLIFGISGYYMYYTAQSNKEVVQKTPSPKFNDVLPGTDKAVLTLSTGKQIALDSTVGSLISEGNVQIKHGGNGLVYSSSDVAVINTMTTPKGGQYQLTLADGTKVWLNAASSITYPTAFGGRERKVTITGEAYFEVANNKEKPFIVNTPEESITVLGTSFNVNVYADEKGGKTSLLEGSVKIDGKLLKPGQAYTSGNVTATNVQQDIAWKNGLFNFQNVRLEQAMRQLARWYNIEVKYKGIPREIEFGGEIVKSLTLQEVISGLEGIEKLHFELTGRILTVFL